MGSVFKNRRINSVFGIFLHLSVIMIATISLYELVRTFYYSLTKYDLLSNPQFVGFKNYFRIFEEDLVQKGIGNTVIMVCAVAVLLLLTAVLPAIFTARLRLPYGIIVICAFSLISLCSMLPNFFNIFFSGDLYGILNSYLVQNSVIHEPIMFTQSHGMLLAIIIMWLFCLTPVFAITYIAARMKRVFLGATVAVCLIPVLMYSGGDIIIGVLGQPSANNSADWIYSVFNDYLLAKVDVGFAYAILFVGIMMLICWCVVVCSAIYGVRQICKKVKSNSKSLKLLGYITFSLALVLFLAVLNCLIMYFLKAYMPIHETLIYPSIFMPRESTRENFYAVLELFDSISPVSRYLANSLFAVPVATITASLFVALPSGVGFGLFKPFEKQGLLLLCFIPFLFVNSFLIMAKLGICDTYPVYMFNFLSSFELLIAVFLVYLAVKLVFYDRKVRISGILIGAFFILSSFYAIGAIRGIWYSSSATIYSESLKTWRDAALYLSASGIARSGFAAANDLLMLLATLAVLIIPLILLLTLYLLYRRNTNNLTKIEKERARKKKVRA